MQCMLWDLWTLHNVEIQNRSNRRVLIIFLLEFSVFILYLKKLSDLYNIQEKEGKTCPMV